jgi:hypothetical protein
MLVMKTAPYGIGWEGIPGVPVTTISFMPAAPLQSARRCDEHRKSFYG